MASDVGKYPHGIWVFKTWVSLWKNITISPSSSSHSSDLAFFFILRHCKSEDQIIQSPTQRSIVQSTSSSLRSSSILRGSRSFLFRSILPLFFFRLFFLCSSDLFFFKYKNLALETQFCYLELESIRLKIYMASYFQLTIWESSL